MGVEITLSGTATGWNYSLRINGRRIPLNDPVDAPGAADALRMALAELDRLKCGAAHDGE
jgi:hypothetical protein